MNPSKSDKTNGLIDFFFGSTGHLWAVLTEALSFGLTAMVYAFKESELLVLRVDVSDITQMGRFFCLSSQKRSWFPCSHWCYSRWFAPPSGGIHGIAGMGNFNEELSP
jgi:hypothetical protein